MAGTSRQLQLAKLGRLQAGVFFFFGMKLKMSITSQIGHEMEKGARFQVSRKAP